MAEEIKTPETEESGKNFILNFIDEDIAEGGQFQGMTVHTRFPPEPNGYLHIGHCKALTIDFGTAEKYNGLCNLRMDDTNPTKEDEEFVEAIKQDIHWLGFDWGDRFFYGSDYFEEDYRQAVLLIKKGLAYVCQLTPEEFKANRGDIGIPAVSPYRDRPIEESLDLFARMRAGEFPNGAMTLRAKIDLTSGNFNMRDPVIYRINHMSHHRQGDKWCIYPMYDFAHPIQDALEGITHSLCSLEFEAHRPLYNWVIEHCELPARPRQIEFARLAIKQDIHWLGFDWGDRFFYGSDYFEEDYRQAVLLIKKGLAYVCQLTPEEFKANRGDIGIPAVSPYRDRPIEESLDLFARMRAGEFPNGAMTLRAKIDLTSGNFNMRDPVIYRINHMSHHRQGDKWCIYPMYDFAHPIQDALEGITHSLCSLEFEAHRPLYNWVIEHCELPARPRQIEFARLGIDHTVMSKRKLRKLVEENYVSGWDDPRMPTLCGLRRRGYTAASIRNFCERIGVAKSPNVIEYGFLEHCLREDLNANAERTMAVLHPVKLTVTNYPEGQSETFTVENNPTDPTQGTHDITFSRHLWIEEDDFMEVPVSKYKRLTPNGPECRLKGAYLVTCTGCVKDENGRVTEVLCTYDPDSRGGDPADGRKVKGATLHWVDAENCMDAEVRLYDNLFSDATPDGPDKDFLDCLNPESLTVLRGCKVEPEMAAEAAAFDKEEGRTGVNAPTFQFMRVGYFCLDNRDSSAEHLVFNRSVSLKDSFKK